MSDFKAKMHKIRLPLGLRPRSSCSPGVVRRMHAAALHMRPVGAVAAAAAAAADGACI